MDFTRLIGQSITIYIPRLGDKILHRATLIGVEPAGLWIEGLDVVSAAYSATTGSKTAARAKAKLFVPFHELALALFSEA
jgi:hypothetical protein